MTSELEDRLDKLAWRMKAAEKFISDKGLYHEFAQWAVSSNNWYPLDKGDINYLIDQSKKHFESESHK